MKVERGGDSDGQHPDYTCGRCRNDVTFVSRHIHLLRLELGSSGTEGVNSKCISNSLDLKAGDS